MAVAAILWATSGTLTELAEDAGANANQIALFAGLFSAAILISYMLLFDRKAFRVRRKDLPALFVFSLITGTLFSLAWYNAVLKTSVTTAVILLNSYPTLVTVASIFAFGEKLTKAKAIALPTTFAGCFLVAGGYDLELIRLNLVGIGLGVFTALSATVYYIWAKKFLKVYSANTMVLYMTVLMIPGLVAITVPSESNLGSFGTDAWALVFLIALIPGTIGFVVSMLALPNIEASRASIVASFEPVAAVIFAVIIVSEVVSGLQILGMGLVMVAIILIRATADEEPEPVIESPPSR